MKPLLILLFIQSTMCKNYEKDPFNMDAFYKESRPSKWILVQTFNTHIGTENIQVAPQGRPLPPGGCDGQRETPR